MHIWWYKHSTKQEEQILFGNFSETAARPSILPEDTSSLHDKVSASHYNRWSTEKVSLANLSRRWKNSRWLQQSSLFMGDMFQDLQWMPKLWVAPNPTFTMSFSYTYTNTIKLNLSIRHSKRLTTVSKNKIELLCIIL